MDSFNALQEELQANVASVSEQYKSALTLTFTNLNLQLADEAITQSIYHRLYFLGCWYLNLKALDNRLFGSLRYRKCR